MSLTAVFVLGLFTGGLTCAAVQGGLLAGLVTRQRAETPTKRHKTNRPSTPPHKQTRHQRRRAKGAEPPPSFAGQLADDLAPVGGFLAGKLVSHAALGALLGAIGSAVQLSVGLRTKAQIVAGLLIIAFGLAQLGAPGFRRLRIEPPASWTRLVRGRARSTSMFAPAMLGFATVLVPCGVTLSVEALALASGSALRGAAIMAVFVLGTGPLFTALGYLARRAATAWRRPIAAITGLIVLLLGLYTLNGGLTVAGSPLAANRLAETLGLAGEPVNAAGAQGESSAVSMVDGRQTVTITARTGRYTPANLKIQAGIPTTLVVRSDNARGCIRSFVIPSMNVQESLPANGDTRIELGVLTPGTLRYTCSMGMYTGRLTIVTGAPQ